MGDYLCKCIEKEEEVQTKVKIDGEEQTPVKVNKEFQQSVIFSINKSNAFTDAKNKKTVGFNIEPANASPKFLGSNKSNNNKFVKPKEIDKEVFLKGTFGPTENPDSFE